MTEIQVNIDQEILFRIAGGDETAFRVLFDQYWEPLYSAVFKMVKSREQARDMLQEIFLKVWNMKEDLPGKENLKSFIYIVARNHVFNELRKKVREEVFSEQLIRHFAEKSPDALEQLFYKESRELVNLAVNQLSSQQRQVYLLARENGLSQKEIGSVLNISVSAVKTHLSRALATIRDFLLKYSHMELLLLILVKEIL